MFVTNNNFKNYENHNTEKLSILKNKKQARKLKKKTEIKTTIHLSILKQCILVFTLNFLLSLYGEKIKTSLKENCHCFHNNSYISSPLTMSSRVVIYNLHILICT